MGLVVVILTASVNGYDLIADPVGWVPVLVEPARDVIRTGR